MMDSAAMNRDTASSSQGELTIRLGSAHGDVTEIGMLFFSPSKVRPEVDSPPLSMDLQEDVQSDLPVETDELSVGEEDGDEQKGRASWLDALWVHEEHDLPPERDSLYNPDDNGLYQRFLLETA
jgi:hypothetical protein